MKYSCYPEQLSANALPIIDQELEKEKKSKWSESKLIISFHELNNQIMKNLSLSLSLFLSLNYSIKNFTLSIYCTYTTYSTSLSTVHASNISESKTEHPCSPPCRVYIEIICFSGTKCLDETSVWIVRLNRHT